MFDDSGIEQQVINFISFLGIKPQNNYFTCYRYPYPILGLIPFKAITQALITKIDLLVFTPEELVIKRLGSGLSFVKLKEKDFNKDIILIQKSNIKKFEIKNWVVLGIDWGYLLTVEADKKYYFHVAKTTGNDFSTENFFNLKQNNFFGLVTDNKTHYL